MKKKRKKLLVNMTTKELAKATVEFDRPFVIDEFSPPDAAAKKRLARAKKGRKRCQDDFSRNFVDTNLLNSAGIATTAGQPILLRSVVSRLPVPIDNLPAPLDFLGHGSNISLT